MVTKGMAAMWKHGLSGQKNMALLNRAGPWPSGLPTACMEPLEPWLLTLLEEGERSFQAAS